MLISYLLISCFVLTVSAIHIVNSTSYHPNSHHVKSHGHKNFEVAVRTYDKDLFLSALDVILQRKIEVKGFYHVSEKVGHWIEVLEEHLMVMDGKRFASNLFSSKFDRHHRQKNTIGMKLSTGWSSILEMVDSIELNFDAATDTTVPAKAQNGELLQSDAYRNMTNMLSNMHLRGGSDKINIKPYISFSGLILPAGSADAEHRELMTLLGEINSINELHGYCSTRRAEHKESFVFLLHNQETNCTSELMKHISAEDYYTEPFLNDIVNSFIVEFPSICISALLGGYVTCGSDYEDGAYDTNIWWATCQHISRLPAIDKDLVVKQAQSSASAAIVLARQMIKNFLFGSLNGVPVSGESSYDQHKYSDRCAYNMHSGSKPADQAVRIEDGVEVPLNRQCSRSEYRFSLIDVLSGLHDDSVLYNKRYNLPALVSDMFLQDATPQNNHKCY